MRDILDVLERWNAANQPLAMATVIQTWGSTPRGVGAKMGVSAQGELCGSVSGGCVEGAVVEASLEALATGRPRLLHFGVADETAWEVGLACGGTIEVFVNPRDSGWYDPLVRAVRAEKGVVAATIIQGAGEQLGRTLVLDEDGKVDGTLEGELYEAVLGAAREALAAGKPTRRALSLVEDQTELFYDVILPSPVLVIVGGTHISVALAELARVIGFRTVIVDPRRSFGNETRFPSVDRLITTWPDKALAEIGINRSTAVAVLTHDPKLDDPALMVALDSPAFYVGALGSKKTQASRRQRLLEAGLTAAQLDRLHGPIGLDIHASTPEEIGLAVLAEIVAAREGA